MFLVNINFDKVSFEFGANKPILSEATFSVREGMKVTLMGQNGAGKSTIFDLITGISKPESGDIHILNGVSIAQARQVISRDQLDLTMLEFFQKCFKEKIYDIDVSTYIPLKDLVRHFEAYHPSKMPFSICPPLFIPYGFIKACVFNLR